MSFCQLRLATEPERSKYVLKNGSSKRGARGPAIHHQLDRVDVRGIVRREEEHGFGNFFRLAPTALRNRRREELRQLSGIFCGSRGPGPALPNGSSNRSHQGLRTVCGRRRGPGRRAYRTWVRFSPLRLSVWKLSAHATNLLANMSMWSRRPSART